MCRRGREGGGARIGHAHAGVRCAACVPVPWRHGVWPAPVSTGLVQSLRAVLVFACSATFFCGNDVAQCFTPAKGLATLVVTAGVAAYAAAGDSTPS